MNAVAHRVEGNANAPVLYMALELSNTTWKVVFGDGARRRQVAVPAGELVKLMRYHAGEPVRRVLPSGKAVLPWAA